MDDSFRRALLSILEFSSWIALDETEGGNEMVCRIGGIRFENG